MRLCASGWLEIGGDWCLPDCINVVYQVAYSLLFQVERDYSFVNIGELTKRDIKMQHSNIQLIREAQKLSYSRMEIHISTGDTVPSKPREHKGYIRQRLIVSIYRTSCMVLHQPSLYCRLWAGGSPVQYGWEHYLLLDCCQCLPEMCFDHSVRLCIPTVRKGITLSKRVSSFPRLLPWSYDQWVTNSMQ